MHADDLVTAKDKRSSVDLATLPYQTLSSPSSFSLETVTPLASYRLIAQSRQDQSNLYLYSRPQNRPPFFLRLLSAPPLGAYFGRRDLIGVQRALGKTLLEGGDEGKGKMRHRRPFTNSEHPPLHQQMK